MLGLIRIHKYTGPGPHGPGLGAHVSDLGRRICQSVNGQLGTPRVRCLHLGSAPCTHNAVKRRIDDFELLLPWAGLVTVQEGFWYMYSGLTSALQYSVAHAHDSLTIRRWGLVKCIFTVVCP